MECTLVKTEVFRWGSIIISLFQGWSLLKLCHQGHLTSEAQSLDNPLTIPWSCEQKLMPQWCSRQTSRGRHLTTKYNCRDAGPHMAVCKWDLWENVAHNSGLTDSSTWNLTATNKLQFFSSFQKFKSFLFLPAGVSFSRLLYCYCHSTEIVWHV